MPIQLLEGVNAVFDFQTDTNAADVAAANVVSGVFPNFTGGNADSWKCAARQFSADITRRTFEMNTFCSGGWVGRTAGFKDIQARLDGFLIKGTKIGNPLYLFSVAGSIPCLATIDSGCTIGFMGICARAHVETTTQEASGSSIEFMGDSKYIAPSTAWITS